MITTKIYQLIIITLSVLFISVSIGLVVAKIRLNEKTLSYDKVVTESKVLEIQRDALVKGIDIQNDAINKLAVDEKSRLTEYSKKLEANSKALKEQMEYARGLQPDGICEYMEKVSYEILEDRK